MMRVIVDRDLCQGHGECCQEAPEVFLLDEEGVLQLVQQEPPEALRPRVERAVQYCPTGALRVEG